METVEFDVLFILGVSISCGLAGAWFFQRLRIPQVVGYIVIGLIVGQSGFGLIDHATAAKLQPFTLFALGIIGFLVGGELRSESFRKYARQFMAILLGEGLGAFFLVGTGSALIMYFAFHNFTIALASGIVFGAIASATDPASTVDVLWENRSYGVLTTSLTAIVALDDALAMTLYGLGTGLAEILTGQSGSIGKEVGKVVLSLGGAVLLGILCAMVLWVLLRKIHQPEKSLAFAVGIILLLISVSAYLDLDVILASMTLGCVLVNTSPRRSADLFKIMRSFSIPIYVLFFVLAGARLGLGQMPGWLWMIVLLYVFGRGIGKIAGTWIGARCTHSEPVVQRYLGLGLFAQGGVAIGLSIVATHHLQDIEITPGLALADTIVSGVAATTLILQLTGPALVKLSVKLAGEAGRNITIDDVIDSWTVADVMDPQPMLIQEHEPVSRAIETFISNDPFLYPVVDREGKMAGVLTFEGLQNILLDQDSWAWLVASDVMTTAKDKARASLPLREAIEQMREVNIDEMPIVNDEDQDRPVGILNLGRVRKQLDNELIQRRQSTPVKAQKTDKSK
ncbi:MAG: cation:proton antiporter [Sedimentisphaerales bacterium]|nr:cation:proton antiporter [Sedimentisphaerales bacterium]